MRITPALLLVTGCAFGLCVPSAWAKGLGQLSDQAPDESDDAPSASSAEGEGDGAATEAHITAPSETSKALSQKLFLATSYGWVHASKKSGSWHSSGMSDLTVGYKFASFGSKSALAGTYRYAPMAVTGTEDTRSYRGVWEGHYVGGRFNYLATPSVNLIGTGELGYVASHLNSVDGLPIDPTADRAGESLALGGGADFQLLDKWAFSAGPRLYAGVGSFTTLQLAITATFLF